MLLLVGRYARAIPHEDGRPTFVNRVARVKSWATWRNLTLRDLTFVWTCLPLGSIDLTDFSNSRRSLDVALLALHFVLPEVKRPNLVAQRQDSRVRNPTRIKSQGRGLGARETQERAAGGEVAAQASACRAPRHSRFQGNRGRAAESGKRQGSR